MVGAQGDLYLRVKVSLTHMELAPTTHCVKPGERKWTDREKSPRDQKCEQTDMKVDGNKVSWKMKCVDGTTGEGTITHNGKDAYTMDNTMKTAQGTMKMHIDGKKIADTCDKK